MKVFCATLCLWLLCHAVHGARDSATEHLFHSHSCALQMKSFSDGNLQSLATLLPPVSFSHMLHEHMKQTTIDTVLLLDVDQASLEIAMNHIESLKVGNASVIPFVVAYQPGVCEKIVQYTKGRCFFDESWVGKLMQFFRSVRVPQGDGPSYRAMFGRMMTTVVTLCAGHNVFLSDSDVVYYLNPLDHILRNADIMVTSTFISTLSKDWGSYYYADQPDKYATLNNGVAFFRNTEAVRNLHLTLATEAISGLIAKGDTSYGFLQVVFNVYMRDHKLSLQPCSALSDPVTKVFAPPAAVLGGNPAGECFDCYSGSILWTSAVVQPLTSAPLTLSVGVFPMQRYVSHCSIPKRDELKAVTATAAAAMKEGDRTGWGWGEDAAPRSTNADSTTAAGLLALRTRPLSVHTNCIEGGGTDMRFNNKVVLLKEINSWYLP